MKKTLFVLSTLVFFASCGGESAEEKAQKELEKQNLQYDLALKEKLDVFTALPSKAHNPENPTSAAKIALGHRLYFDNQLSKEGNISCNSCHNLATYGVDNLPTSPGDAGKNGDRNSPTVLNAALHTTQFWDGRAKDVEEQAGMPVLNPVEMAIPDEQFLVKRLSAMPEYTAAFAEAFPDDAQPMNYANIRKAIACFERELLTPSRFDQYLQGDKSALTLQEKKGLTSFINIGCTTCHTGAAIGGAQLQKFGVHHDYWTLTKSENIDKGRSVVTGNPFEDYMFKVPSLRNVEKTGPYFHDGSVSDLKEAVRIIALAQLDYKMNDKEVENVVAFLSSLTGAVPEKYQKAPQ